MSESIVRECWNAFCVAEEDVRFPDPQFDTHHVDVTGRSWEQAPGTQYCAECGGYVDVAQCGHGQTVVTIYDRLT